MSHGNATLSPLGRLKLARFHVQSGSSGDRGAVPGVYDHGAALEARIRHLRVTRRLGPVQINVRVGVSASTVCRVLVRSGLNRLDHMDRATGEVIRRYERDNPGDLIHVNIKKFALIPPGGGWKIHGREATAPGRSGRAGYAYVHSAVDDRSRLAYSEVNGDEFLPTTIAFWHRAAAFYASHGITVREVITDNGVAYRAHAWKHDPTAADATSVDVRNLQTPV